MTIDSRPGVLGIEKLRKVAALMDSPSEGERSAAMERVRKMLADAGKSFRDLPELLADRPQLAAVYGRRLCRYRPQG